MHAPASPFPTSGIHYIWGNLHVCNALHVLQYNFGLDPDEKRFKRRLEATTALGFSSALDAPEDADLELTAKEIEQLQALEAELARKASSSNRAGPAAAERAPVSPEQSDVRIDVQNGMLSSPAQGEQENEHDTAPLRASGPGPEVQVQDDIDRAIDAVAAENAADDDSSARGAGPSAGVSVPATGGKKKSKQKKHR